MKKTLFILFAIMLLSFKAKTQINIQNDILAFNSLNQNSISLKEGRNNIIGTNANYLVKSDKHFFVEVDGAFNIISNEVEIGQTQYNDPITFPTSGITGIGISGGCIYKENFEFSIAFQHYASWLTPPVENASATFDRNYLAPSFKYIYKPSYISEAINFKLGLGFIITNQPTLKFNFQSFSGNQYEIKYKNAVGSTFHLEVATRIIPKFFMFRFYLKYTLMTYKTEFASSIYSTEFDKLKANGLDIGIGMGYCF